MDGIVNEFNLVHIIIKYYIKKSLKLRTHYSIGIVRVNKFENLNFNFLGAAKFTINIIIKHDKVTLIFYGFYFVYHKS